MKHFALAQFLILACALNCSSNNTSGTEAAVNGPRMCTAVPSQSDAATQQDCAADETRPALHQLLMAFADIDCGDLARCNDGGVQEIKDCVIGALSEELVGVTAVGDGYDQCLADMTVSRTCPYTRPVSCASVLIY